MAYAWPASSGEAYAVASCRTLGGVLPLEPSTRATFCSGGGSP